MGDNQRTNYSYQALHISRQNAALASVVKGAVTKASRSTPKKLDLGEFFLLAMAPPGPSALPTSSSTCESSPTPSIRFAPTALFASNCSYSSSAQAFIPAKLSTARPSSTAASTTPRQASAREATELTMRKRQAKKGGSREAENLLRLERQFVNEKQAEAASTVGTIYRKAAPKKMVISNKDLLKVPPGYIREN